MRPNRISSIIIQRNRSIQSYQLSLPETCFSDVLHPKLTAGNVTCRTCLACCPHHVNLLCEYVSITFCSFVQKIDMVRCCFLCVCECVFCFQFLVLCVCVGVVSLCSLCVCVQVFIVFSLLLMCCIVCVVLTLSYPQVNGVVKFGLLTLMIRTHYYLLGTYLYLDFVGGKMFFTSFDQFFDWLLSGF